MNRAVVNRKCNKEIDQYCFDHDVYSCEVGLDGCTIAWGLTRCHRHKRRWYYDKPDSMLWKRSQWLLACISCHEKLERDPELTIKVFEREHGKEEL